MVDDDGELCAELRRQHVKMHGDGKNQTTSVPHTRDYKRTAGDLNEGGCILVAYRVPKNKVKKKGAPNGKTTGAKLVRSCDADVFGQVGVYVSRLEAHAQLAAFRDKISGKGRGGGSKPLAQRNQPAQSPSPTSTRSLTQTDDVAPERIDRIVHSCVERMVRAIVATTGVAADEFWSAGGTSALATVRRRAIDAVGHTNVHLLVKVDTPVPVPVPVAAPSLMGEWLSIQGPLFREAKRAAKRGGRRHSGTVKAAKRIIFSRRARTYRRALTQLYNEGSCSFEKIINMVGTYKTHRNAVDFDSAFLKALGEGAVIAHPGTMAHHETYHQSILDVKRSQKEFAAHTVVSPSKGRDLEPVAINADREHGVVLKRQRLQDAAEWTTSVLKRMKLV